MKRLLSYMLVSLIAMAIGNFAQPFSQLPTSAQAGCRAFSETGMSVCGKFLQYWQAHGGLAQQGLPLSGEFTEVSDLNGKPYTVQYFERAVFEAHPENAAPYDVLLSQLGTFQFKAKYPNGAPNGQQPPTPVPPTGSQPITFSGNTTQKTTAFHLNAGNYTASWKAQDSSSYGCYMGVFLKNVDPNVFFLELIANKVVGQGATEAASTQLYNVKAGEYYFDVNSSCNWEVSIKR